MNFFDRLPPGIFGPLTGRNARRAWELLERLFDRFFGPDCVPTYPDGYLQEQITKEIERFLMDKSWDVEDEADPEDTIANRAGSIFNRLADTGWIVKERLGVRTFVSMKPSVMSFFATLQAFVEDGPQHIGGSIQLVHSQLQSVEKDPLGQAAGFAQAAKLCGRMINSMGAMSIRVRDLMQDLSNEDATPSFVRRFFTEHIGDIYLRDFKQLRTENHPISKRFDILNIINDVTGDPEKKRLLLEGYCLSSNMAPDEAQEALDRDIDKFSRLQGVEAYLDRMDRVIEIANQRAMAIIDYRLRAADRIEHIIGDTMQAINKAEACGMGIEGRILPASPVVSEARMRLPKPAPIKPHRKLMVPKQMTDRQRAMQDLRRAVIANRDMTAASIRRYVQAKLEEGRTIPARDLPVIEVRDAISYLGLVRMSSIVKHAAKNLSDSSRRLGFDVQPLDDDGETVETEFFITPNFQVTRSSK